MSKCAMGYGNNNENDNKISLIIKPTEEASRTFVLQMLRDFYWPTKSSNSFLLRILIIFSIIFLFLGRGASILAPWFLGKATTSLTQRDAYYTTVYLTLFSVTSVLSLLLDELRNTCYRYVQCKAIVKLSIRLYRHLHDLNFQWFADSKGGEIIRSMNRGLESTRELSQFGLLLLVPTLFEAIGICVAFMIFFGNPYLSLTLVIGLALYLVVSIMITNVRIKTRKKLAQSDNDMHSISTEGVNNFETVKYYTNEKYEITKYTNAVLSHEKCNWKVLNSLSLINITQDFIKQTTIFFSLGLGAYQVYYHNAEIGMMMSIQAYSFILFKPLNILGTIYSTIIKAGVSLQDAANILNTKPTICDKDDAIDLVLEENEVCDGPLVEYDNVLFSYATEGCPMDNLTLCNINFTINYGDTVAIVGPTGSGKTTICRLLCRLYDTTSGSIKIKGIPITDYTQQSLRKHIGVVAQDTMLFHSSIRENVRYAKLDATDDEIYTALKKAQLYDRVMELPNKLDSIVGERGIKLSGGEKQRLSIARCFLKDPPIIVLDEATSALDSKTESNIQETILHLTKTKTSLVIAHRLSTIVNADKILVVNKGTLVEYGTHTELLSNNGLYKSLWDAQLKNRADLLEE